MTPGEKYSVKIPDEDIEGFKETFRMFDKVPGLGLSLIDDDDDDDDIRMVTAQCPPRSWGR